MTRRELIERVSGAQPHHVDYLTRTKRFNPAPRRDASLRHHYEEAHVLQLQAHVNNLGAKRAKRDAQRALRQEARSA